MKIKILDYIAAIQEKIPRYQLARNNCSHIVAKALMEGANQNPSFTPHAGQYSKLGRLIGGGIVAHDVSYPLTIAMCRPRGSVQ